MMYQDSCTHVLPFLNPCMQKVHTMNLQLNAFMIWAFFNNYPSRGSFSHQVSPEYFLYPYSLSLYTFLIGS